MSAAKFFRSIDLEFAKKVASKAVEKAKELNVPGAIAVVDNTGNLVYLEVLDETMPAAANITIGKAATSAVFCRPTIVLEKLIQEDRMVMQNISGVTNTPYVPLMGAYPIVVNGSIIGAIGIGGALTGENDELIAKYAVENS